MTAAGPSAVLGAATAEPGEGAAPSPSLLPVLVLAALLTFADGFWIVSLHGAIGAVTRVQSPFATWWHDSAMLLPVFLAAVAAPVALVRRHRSRSDGSPRRGVLRTGLLITACSTAVGVAWAAGSAAVDYVAQTRLAGERAALHADLADHGLGTAAGHALSAAQTVQERQATLATHVLGVEQATALLLVTNVLLVVWFAALRGGELDM